MLFILKKQKEDFIMNRQYRIILIFTLSALILFSCKSNKEVAQTRRPIERKEKTPARVVPSETKPTSTVKKQSIDIPLTPKDNKVLYNVVEKWLGTPHVTGGCSTSGIDCSCFVINVYKEVYKIDLYRSSADMLQNITLVERDELKEGDIVFFKVGSKQVNHVGIYLKEEYFAHTSTSKGVMISKLTEPYWNKYFFTGGRHSKVQTKY